MSLSQISNLLYIWVWCMWLIRYCSTCRNNVLIKILPSHRQPKLPKLLPLLLHHQEAPLKFCHRSQQLRTRLRQTCHRRSWTDFRIYAWIAPQLLLKCLHHLAVFLLTARLSHTWYFITFIIVQCYNVISSALKFNFYICISLLK